MKHKTGFIQAHKHIFYCVGIVTEEGECIPLSAVDKLIYFHMSDRQRLFVDNGKKHFESQKTIASCLSIDTKTAAKSLTKLLEAGVIFGHKETHQTRGFKHWVYTGVAYPLNTYGSNIPAQSTRPDTASEEEFDDPF